MFAIDDTPVRAPKKSDPNLFGTLAEWKASPFYRPAPKLRARRLWSREEELLVADRYPSETPVRDIAPVVGRTIGAIRAKARKLGFFRPKKGLDKNLLLTPPPPRRSDLTPTWSADLDFLTVPLSQWKAVIPRDSAGRPLWYNNLIDALRGVWCRSIASATIAEIFGVSRASIWAAADSRNLPRRTDHASRGRGMTGKALDALIAYDEIPELARNALPRIDSNLAPGRDRYFQDAARSMRGAREAIRRRKRSQRITGGGLDDIGTYSIATHPGLSAIWS
ncbi:hypothetical protein ASAP_2977 [Asaia bogorensis]|uniref:Uncharacterized protein n=3 Tax=Asaia TaxID=91914 RepID=A0A060QM72_9PROT|nr:hypothetical protein ASAP_2977 [Asaia bogorensis]